MHKQKQAEQLRIAADIIENNLEWEWMREDGDQWIPGKPRYNIFYRLDEGCLIRIKPVDPHPNRAEVEEGIKAGKKWQFKSKDQNDWPRSYAPDDLVKPKWIEQLDYRLVPEPKKIPLGPEDVPPGSIIGGPTNHHNWCSVIYCADFGIAFVDSFPNICKKTFKALFDGSYQISTDSGKTWKPCYKEVEDC